MFLDLEKKINYKFKNLNHLENVFNHPSFSKNSKFQEYEFLGDRVISLVLSNFLFNKNYALKELANKLNYLINSDCMFEIASNLNFNSYFKHNIQIISKKNLADILESLIGAIFIDSSYETVSLVILNLWDFKIKELTTIDYINPKMKLQELSQAKGLGLPTYETQILKKNNKDFFLVKVSLINNLEAYSENINKHKASIEAAILLLRIINEQKI